MPGYAGNPRNTKPAPPPPKFGGTGFASGIAKAFGHVGQEAVNASHGQRGVGAAIAKGAAQATRQANQKTIGPSLVKGSYTGPGSDILTSGGGNYGSQIAKQFKLSPQYKNIVLSVFKSQSIPQQKAIITGALKTPTNFESKLILDYTKQLALTERERRSGSEPGAGTGFLATFGPEITHAVLAATHSLPAGLPKFMGAVSSDLYNLPGGTVQGLYGLGSQVGQGHFGNALHMVVDPYVQLLEHPLKSIEEHPVNTALMLAGPKAVLGKAIGGAGRLAGAEAFSTAREPIYLPDVAGYKGPPIEARSYSRDAFNMMGQKALDRYRGNVAKNPRFTPKSVKSLTGAGPEAKVRKVVNEMTSVRQMEGRTERGVALKAVIHAAAHKDVRGVVSHILQGIIRTPESAEADLRAEIERLRPFADSKIRKPGVIMAKRQVASLERALQHLDKMPEAFKNAQDLRPVLHAMDAYLARLGLLDPEQALRSRLMPYAMAHMGAHMDPGHGLSIGDHPLATDEILQHLKDNGVPDPAYVGHYPQKVAPWRFYSAYRMARGSLGQKRTGEAFRTGAYDHSYEGLAAQVARTAEAVTRASLHDRIINRFGVGRPEEMLTPVEKAQLKNIRTELKNPKLTDARRDSLENRLAELKSFTPEEARRFAHASTHDENGPIPGAFEYAPITRAPKSALGQVKDLQNPHELKEHVNDAEVAAVHQAMADVVNRSDNKRNLVLVPREAVDQFTKQFARHDGISKQMGRFTQQFRRTVLPYSAHWMFQIVSEAGLRGLISGAVDPRNIVAGRQLMHALQDTPEGRAALSEMVNAVFYNQHETMGVYHGANPVVAAAKAAPITRQIIAAHNRYADFVGHKMTAFEHEFRLMGLGKISRQQIQEFTGSYQAALRLQGRALSELATKLKTDPTLVAKFGRQIDETFGKYNKFSPALRSAIQSYFPFLPWYLNAARYVFWSLPAHHPVSSALMASLRQTINQDVKDGKAKPLDQFSADQLARLSPFGIGAYPTGSGESKVGAVLGDAAGTFLPQIEGGFYNLAGVNSFMSGPLKGPHGDVKGLSGDAVRAALENLAEAFVPGIRYGREALEGTDSSQGTSTIVQPQGKGNKLGTGILGRLFNPLYSFEKAKKNQGGASGGSSSGGSPSLYGPSSGGGSSGSSGGSSGTSLY